MDEQAAMQQYYLATAVAAARAAGKLALEAAHQPRTITYKGPKDIVTEVDVACEKVIIEIIHTRHPDHNILSEEAGRVAAPQVGDNDYTWIIDPIDGTNNYAAQLPFWCISVALARGKQPIVAAVYDPTHEELYTAVAGEGAFLNGQPLRVNQPSELHVALIACDTGSAEEFSRRSLNVTSQLRPHVHRVRILGSAVLAISYVAAGRLDLFYHLNLHPWDVAAALLLVREAGGRGTTFNGQDCNVFDRELVAANPSLLAAFLNIPHMEEVAHQSLGFRLQPLSVASSGQAAALLLRFVRDKERSKIVYSAAPAYVL